MVTKQKPAGQGGLEQKATDSNLDKNQENVKKLSGWALRRIAQLAQDRQATQGETLEAALYALENEALVVLAGELIVFPELATIVPLDFIKRLQGSRSALTDFERGIAILLNENAKQCLPGINIDVDMDEFIHLKWETLGGLLAGGLQDE